MDRKLLAITLGAGLAVLAHISIDVFEKWPRLTLIDHVASVIGASMVVIALWVLFTVILYGLFCLTAAIRSLFH
jgi:hypothetical protein